MLHATQLYLYYTLLLFAFYFPHNFAGFWCSRAKLTEAGIKRLSCDVTLKDIENPEKSNGVTDHISVIHPVS